MTHLHIKDKYVATKSYLDILSNLYNYCVSGVYIITTTDHYKDITKLVPFVLNTQLETEYTFTIVDVGIQGNFFNS